MRILSPQTPVPEAPPGVSVAADPAAAVAETPMGAALKALFATDDAMPESEHSIAVYTHLGVVVVLLDTVAAWSAWVVALQARREGAVSAQAGIHVMTAEGCVCGCPVMLVSGDYVPERAA